MGVEGKSADMGVILFQNFTHHSLCSFTHTESQREREMERDRQRERDRERERERNREWMICIFGLLSGAGENGREDLA